MSCSSSLDDCLPSTQPKQYELPRWGRLSFLVSLAVAIFCRGTRANIEQEHPMRNLLSFLVAIVPCLVVQQSAIAGPPCGDNIGGHWTIRHQSGATANMEITQNSTKLTGAGTEGQNSGTVTFGRVEDRNVILVIKWSNDHIGEYNGSIGLNGRISGVNHDQTNPNAQQLWNTDESRFCKVD
jgi:hypothetical protein